MKRRHRRTKAEIDKIREALHATLEQEHPMTVRQVFYRMVSQAVIQKTENEYKNTVGRLLLDMRREGDGPFSWVSDNTRWMRKPRSFHTLSGALWQTARTYRRALWDNQSVYVEVWTEKDALAGVLMEETSIWDVPLMVSRGFSSATYLYEAAESIQAEEKPAYLYYFGDHDPSGIHIDRVIERELRRYAPDAEIYFQRVAVTPEQIEGLQLPTRPTKKDDSRSKSFEGESVEVDAIPPPKLREFVRDCIEQHVDREAYEQLKVAEKSEREILNQLCKQLDGADPDDSE